MERLDKFLAHRLGISRKDAKALLRQNRITLDGVPVTSAETKCSETDTVALDGKPLPSSAFVYIMMNKPLGAVCSTVSDRSKTVFQLLDPDAPAGLSIVGRLDLDTEGLLILTTDGDLNHRLTSPKHHVPKTYYVELETQVSEAFQKKYSEAVSSGIEIPPEDHEPGARCRGGKLEWESGNTCRLTIYEGLYHEVKRIFAALGNRVIYLKRISMNQLALDPAVAPGEYRELSEQELSVLTLTNHIL